MGCKKIIAYEKPHLIKYFKNKDDAYKYGIFSNKKVEFICPCCNKICISIIASFVKSEHVLCPTCNDGFSYPEKFMANVLTQLGIKYTRQYKIFDDSPYRFDFEFELNNKKYLIEMDGGLGHGNRLICNNKDNDEIKNKLAIDNDYTLIRIDCNYTSNRFEYIKKNILFSLNEIFDMSIVNWEQCNLKSVKSLYYEVLNCYEKNTKYASEIANILDISISTVVSYLNSAMKLGLIKNETIWKKRYKEGDSSNYRTYTHSKQVYCYEDAKIFNSIQEACEYYNVLPSAISQSMKHGYGANNKHFVLVKDLPIDFDYKPLKIDNKTYKTTPIFYQYDMDDNLINIYHGYHELKTMSNIKNPSCVYKILDGERKTVCGFKWKMET